MSPERRTEVELTRLQASQDMIRRKRLLRKVSDAVRNRNASACGELEFCTPSKTARKSSGNCNDEQVHETLRNLTSVSM
jgi:hypothetical protein